MSDHHNLFDKCQHCANCDCQSEYIGKLEEEVGERQEEIVELREEVNDNIALLEEVDREADELEEELIRMEKERDEWRRSAEILRETIEDATADGCEYGDDCPLKTNHYQCRSCQLLEGLDLAMDAWEMEDD